MIFVKLVGVIVIWFAALQVWDIARLQILRVVRSFGGVLRFLGGCALGLSALIALYLWVPVTAATFSWLAIATFLAALVAEFLIGDDIRRGLRSVLRHDG